MVDGVILPRFSGYRGTGQPSEGRQERQQAALLCDLAVKYHLTQQVGLPTRDKEILDRIWSSNPDLVSNVLVDPFKDITDHSVVTATTTFRMHTEPDKEDTFLLDSGRRFKKLDFSKAPWSALQTKLADIVWSPLQLLDMDDVTGAHVLFIDTILPVIEELVPEKVVGKKFGHRRNHKICRRLWRKLDRTKKQLP